MTTSSNSQGAKLASLAEQLKTKFKWRELKDEFKAAGLETAHGWEAFVKKLSESTPDVVEKAIKHLNQVLEDLVYAGTKDLHIFDLEDDQTAALARSFNAINVGLGNFSSSFPNAISASSLKTLSFDHELVFKKVRVNGDISLVFCARRTEEERSRYEISEVTSAVQSAFAGYDEFIAIKKRDYQIFDVLTLRVKLKRLELLVDQPGRMRLPETSEVRSMSVFGRCVTLIPELEEIYNSNKPLNLYACIDGLYSNSAEGRVSELAFRSPTHSTKKEVMTSKKDLRTELFHASGVAAVGDITPYDVNIVWDSVIGMKGSVEVRVGMPISFLSNEDPYVRFATIYSAWGDSSIVAVANKLVKYT
jgi:hypothetical protein